MGGLGLHDQALVINPNMTTALASTKAEGHGATWALSEAKGLEFSTLLRRCAGHHRTYSSCRSWQGPAQETTELSIRNASKR